MKYFLDTNVIIDALKDKTELLRSHFEKVNSTDIYIPSIVIAELEYGALHSNNYERNKSLYELFIKEFAVIPFDRQCCESYGRIRQKLSEKGLVIGSNDMLIAATSIRYSAVLVTHNVREFSRIDGLVVEDWLK